MCVQHKTLFLRELVCLNVICSVYMCRAPSDPARSPRETSSYHLQQYGQALRNISTLHTAAARHIFCILLEGRGERTTVAASHKCIRCNLEANGGKFSYSMSKGKCSKAPLKVLCTVTGVRHEDLHAFVYLHTFGVCSLSSEGMLQFS